MALLPGGSTRWRPQEPTESRQGTWAEEHRSLAAQAVRRERSGQWPVMVETLCLAIGSGQP